MRYTPYRGLTAVTNWDKLKYAAMNLKKLAIHKWKERSAPLQGRILTLLQSIFYAKNPIPV